AYIALKDTATLRILVTKDCSFVRNKRSTYDALMTINDESSLLEALKVARESYDGNCSRIPSEDVVTSLKDIGRDEHLVLWGNYCLGHYTDNREAIKAYTAAAEIREQRKEVH
ncbi:MAG: hypothetical protein AAB649_03020, partial [Patescibacteria group bacterium]